MHRFIKIFGFSLLLLSTQVIAICSQYMGSATLNEAGKVGFIEIKLLDGAIAPAIYNTWSAQVCEEQHGNCSGALSLSTGTLSNAVYVVVPTNFIPSNKAFDILLIDDIGNTIDYLSVDYTLQQDNNCSLTYDWTAPQSNSHTYRRMPDGTGDWGDTGSGNSGGDTGGGSNEGGSDPVAEWRFEEASWTGTSGEVLDSSNNSLDGTTFLAANTGDSDPARVGNPGTCRYGDFNYSGVQVGDNDLLDMSNSFTLSAWIRHQTSFSNLVEDIIVTKGYGGSLNYLLSVQTDGDLRLTWNGGSLDSNTAIIKDGSWVHVAASYQNGEQVLYINGVADASSAATDTLVTNADDLAIGGLSSFFWWWGFVGQIDEVKIYDYALSASEVTAVYNETHPCDTSVDHFEIDTLDQTGITCEADNIIIKACADASCSTINPDAVDVELSINNTVYKTVTVAGNTGTSTSYSHTTLGTAALSLDQTYQCTNTPGTTPCDVDFKDSGFVFRSDIDAVISTQISAKPSNVGFNEQTLYLQAVKTDDQTKACVGAFPNGGNIPVDLSYTCHNDSSNCTRPVSLTNNGNTVNFTDSIVSQVLLFGTDSKAEFYFSYPDAGKLILNAETDVEVEDSDGNTITKTFNGSSEPFVERPFAFKLGFSNDVNGANAFAQDGDGDPDATESAFKKAGENFKMTATAVQWVNGQDTDNNGVPDNFSDVIGNDTAEYFASETLDINDELLLPSLLDGGVPGILAPKISSMFTNDSEITDDYTYSEVGIVKLSAELNDGDYLGAGNIYGEVTNVGRFYPAYFTQSVESHGNLVANHSAMLCSSEIWLYAGQTLTSGATITGSILYEAINIPSIKITAFNTEDEITENYTAVGFVNLAATGIDITLPTADDEKIRVSPLLPPDDKVKITAVMTNGSDPVLFSNSDKGVLLYTLDDGDHFVYEHTKYSKLSPFSAKIPFLINKIEDSDLVNLYSGSDPDIVATEKVLTEGVDIHFGRWRMENSFAPETSALSMTMLIEHFNGTEFITNPEENCIIPEIVTKHETGAIGSGGLTLWDYRLFDADNTDDLGTSHTDASVDGSVYDSGVYRELFFSAPFSTVENRQGPLKVEYQVPAWLQYDWTGDGNFTNNPSATLTFGIFRGNDRIIYQREIQ